jgi:PAS domain-containing protein
VGVSEPSVAKVDVPVSEGVPAAIAVVSGVGSIERATRAFMDQLDGRDGSLASCSHELELITTGQADHLTVLLDGVEADLVAVVNRDGRHLGVLTIPDAGGETGAEPVSPLFDEPLDDSPAIVWLKDLDGRYLRVNRRYTEQLETDSEHVCGRTDVELTATGSIEGLRLDDEDIAGREPLELEYLIGAFEERPAFAALRFALRDADGQPTATCSVAAPLAEASLARSECERLMKIDRWRRLDAGAIRKELLDDWGLTLADGSSGPPLDRDDRVAAALVERDEALARAARLEQELSKEREQQGSLRAESERAAQRADELDGAATAERERSEDLGQSLATAESRVGELEGELTAVRAELEEHRLGADRVAEAVVERDEALATLAQIERELSEEREQQGSLRAESERAARQADELDGAVAAERARSEELSRSLAAAEARASELEGELTAARAELEEHRLDAQAVDATAPASESNGGLEWSTGAQRALSAALVGLTEWRPMLEHAVGALGSEGGWDAAIAWCPDGPRGSMRCGAMWLRDAKGLAKFETRTWQYQQDASTAEFGRARNRMATTCLLELESAEDPLLRAAAAEGMGSALLVPITDGGETIAMLELLARTASAPNAELMVSLEAIALQLGAVAQLIKLADVPRWRTGRV